MRHDVTMTKLDEHGVVPAVDPAARERLAVALDRDGVVAGSLIGSQATGEAGPLSDIDLAVWVEPALSPRERGALRLALANAAAAALDTDEVDVVILNDAPPPLRRRAQSAGARLVDRDPLTRVRFETHALLEYLDTKPLRACPRGRAKAAAAGGPLW